MILSIEPPRLRVVMILIALLATLALSNCASISESYRDADAKTYQAIAPEYEAHLRGDGSLSEDERELALGTLASWRARLLAAGAEVE